MTQQEPRSSLSPSRLCLCPPLSPRSHCHLKYQGARGLPVPLLRAVIWCDLVVEVVGVRLGCCLLLSSLEDLEQLIFRICWP
uniref:Uncharacterized protein n=1 Tax=Arundo donax TaxID=35708 RepID=A0A0A9FKV8_ARUDO